MFDLRLELWAKTTWIDGQPIGVANGEWYRLVTAMFLHASVAHIFMNMLSLYFIGPMLEALIGRLRFVLVYFVGGIAGSVASYWFMTSASGPSLGASGAISAVFGCLVVIGLRRRILNVNAIVVVLALNVIIPFQNPSIDWRDHLGGVVAGALMGAAFVYGPEILRTLGRTHTSVEQQRKVLNGLQFGTIALVLALSAGATAIHTSHLNDPASRTRSTSQDSESASYPQAGGSYPHWG
jgi:membrane associated rhomboid family serine protease